MLKYERKESKVQREVLMICSSEAEVTASFTSESGGHVIFQGA